jgi:RNA recognition motif-containing protein
MEFVDDDGEKSLVFESDGKGAGVLIDGLRWYITDGRVEQQFSSFCHVDDICFAEDKANGKSLGTCLVRVDSQRAASHAVDSMNNKHVNLFDGVVQLTFVSDAALRRSSPRHIVLAHLDNRGHARGRGGNGGEIQQQQKRQRMASWQQQQQQQRSSLPAVPSHGGGASRYGAPPPMQVYAPPPHVAYAGMPYGFMPPPPPPPPQVMMRPYGGQTYRPPSNKRGAASSSSSSSRRRNHKRRR